MLPSEMLPSEMLPSGTRAQTERTLQRRFLAIALPHLATDRIERRLGLTDDERGPLATVVRAASTLRLVAINRAAAAYGLAPGLPLADARARHPDLSLADADTDGEMKSLAHLADWCCRWTPYVALDAPDGLMLDITGCAHLFGGEAALRQTVLDRLQAQGFTVEATIASTPACAWGVARFSRIGTLKGTGIISNTGARAALLPLPVAALKLPADTIDALARVGLKRIGDLIDLPRAPLTARFGPQLLDRLDQALGLGCESISPRVPVTPYVAERRFFEPISQDSDILATIETLGETLSRTLEDRGDGARYLVCTLFRVDGHVATLSVGTSRPVRRGSVIRALFAERLKSLASEIEAGFGFDLVRLSVTTRAPLSEIQTELQDSQSTTVQSLSDASDDLDQLIDRLGVRFGPEQIVRFAAVDTHNPERAVRAIPACRQPIEPEPALPAHAMSQPPGRPLRLFAKPEPIDVMAAIPLGAPLRFRWRRVLHTVAHAEGPERIAPEWWRAETQATQSGTQTRDYFRVEDVAGQRHWLFRSGLYERAGDTPQWFIHGVFA
jgi:protein ImuB